MPDIYRTISGALFRAPNLVHNNRDHIPWNAVQERADRNVVFLNGTKDFTLEQIYDKLFQKSYEEWLAKERKKSRAKDDPPTYYEKIEKDKKKHLSYEIIWQIGDMDDTGYDTDHLSAIWAEDVLLRFAEHLMYEVPNVTYVSKERLEDPEWKPPFEAGVVITNFAFNGDESTPHLHMTFVPYSDNCSRGQKTQNALAQTFTRMGYKTTMEQARDASDELVWQDTPEGRKPQMVRTAYGAVEWIEEQKNWIAEDMEKNIGWTRFYKGKNERGDLLLSDYRRERAAEKALEAEREKERQENALQHIQTLSEKTMKKLDEEISAKNMVLEFNDALIEIKKSDVAEWEEKVEYSKSEYLKADELLTDKKKEVEQAQGKLSRVTEKLDEATRKKEIALDLYHRLSTDTENTDLFDKVVDLSYENEQLRSKIQVLQDKLEKAYEFMKQFVINGRNMLDVFRERIGEVKEWVHRKVAGMGR
ncbi:hypothetical protein [Acetivibrio mesophilus]|uniref:Plasmid recombination enzyme n=1 Tax=Acetivibrio mesophilus TaxID=2487273 RepID=A0A4Q0I2N9_9FIRM|nr:hypothetical protein [Acetivibrio mesophilus]RXE57977.1 hypothetical protein EFD62_14870 [Acetivibrio mesophilus]